MKISSRVKDLHLFIYFLFYFGRPRLEKKKSGNGPFKCGI